MDGNRPKIALLIGIGLTALLVACGETSSDPIEEHRGEPVVLRHEKDPSAPSSSLCLACHSQPTSPTSWPWSAVDDLQAVAPDVFFASAHRELACVDCHEDQSALPHERFDGSGAPLVRADPSDVCRSCHGGPAEHFLDSVHGTVIRLGDDRAPGCTDCHTAHSVEPIKTWAATEKAVACGQCHDGADATFAGSLTHVEPTVDRLPVDYVATRFFGALVVAVVGIGILHVELDMLRWLRGKLGRKSREDKQ
jgi:hypothetical protein